MVHLAKQLSDAGATHPMSSSEPSSSSALASSLASSAAGASVAAAAAGAAAAKASGLARYSLICLDPSNSYSVASEMLSKFLYELTNE